MYALSNATWSQIHCGNYAAAAAQAQELLALAQEKGAAYWTAFGMINQGCVLALTGRASNAISMLSSGIIAWRSTGANLWMPFFLSRLAHAYAEVGQFEEAWSCIDEAMTAVETTRERWCEAGQTFPRP
jgi:tetratricopeptide (TPR) repeat protein